jgi:guanylate kinase
VAGLQRILDEDKFAMLKIDTQGAVDVMERRPDALTIFILPPSVEELERRIRSRATDSEEKIQIRMQNARDELAVADRYQYKIVNEDLESALAEIQKILTDA